jgi:hypothetical protein
VALSACSQAFELGSKQRAAETEPTSGRAGIAGTASLAGSAADAGLAGKIGIAPSAGTGGAGGTGSVDDAAGQVSSAGEDPGLNWSSNFETGNLSEWTNDGAAVSGSNQHAADASVSQDAAHGGSSAMKITFDTSDGRDHFAELYRLVEPGGAYYGAWYLIPESHAPAVYWSVLYFFTESKPGDPKTRHSLWDVNLNDSAVYFYDETTKRFVDSVTKPPYPIGRWFHLEVYLEHPAGGDAHIVVWQDGQQLFDVPALGMAPNESLYFALGSETDHLTPPNCVVYIDDASVSTRRVGP